MAKNTITVSILDEKYANQAAECLAKGFLREPMTKSLQVTYDEMLDFTQKVIQSTIDLRLSFVAIDSETDKVVGTFINKDLKDELFSEDVEFTEKLLPVFELLDAIDEAFYKNNSEIKHSEVFHYFMLAVDETYKGNNISTHILEAAKELVEEKGYKRIIAEATGPISQHILLNKYDFDQHHNISYSEFEFEGNKVFSNITEASDCKLLIKELA